MYTFANAYKTIHVHFLHYCIDIILLPRSSLVGMAWAARLGGARSNYILFAQCRLCSIVAFAKKILCHVDLYLKDKEIV